MIIHSDISPINKIQSILPQSVNFCISHIPKDVLLKVNEIRLRKNGVVTVTIDGENVLLTNCGLEKKSKSPCFVTEHELEEFLYKACKCSMYSHEDSIKNFFVTYEGIRIGLGAATSLKGNPQEITSVNIRLPGHVDNCSGKSLEYLRTAGLKSGRGLLVISEPGVGKTTLLRDLAHKLSCCNLNDSRYEMLRVAVIDERYEIYMPHLFDNCCIDFVSGTGKIQGIETAVRLLSPQVVVCDEISGPQEAEQITLCKNSGIVFAASYHCTSVQDALRRKYIKKMFDEDVFGAFCVLKRINRIVSSEIVPYGKEYD